MQIKEAIEILNVNVLLSPKAFKFKEAVELANNALEKQIPFKPKEYEDKYYACKCGNILLMKWKKYNTELTPKSEGLPYCLNCGQTLDWSEENA